MEQKQYWLFNPGPVNTSDGVKRAAIQADLCHREVEYSELMANVRAGLLRAANVSANQYKTALIAGSGTSAMELGVRGLVRPGKSLLVIRNGVYGERIARIAELAGIACHTIDCAWHERPMLDAIEQKLRAHDDIDAVALVHHETTTGLLNLVEAVGALAARHEKLFFVDSVSGFGGEELNLGAAHVDIMAGTANKCLHGLPGVSFVFVSSRAQERLSQIKLTSLYFDLANYLKTQDEGTIAFTPSVPATYALNQALIELEAEGGVAARIALYKKRSAYLRTELQKLGLKLYLEPTLLSNSITTLALPKGMSYQTLHDALKANGYVIYAGQGKLVSEIFRIANLGHVPMEIYEGLVKGIRTILEKTS